MAAKTNKKRAKAREEPKPVQQPHRAPERLEDSSTAPADSAPGEHKPGPPVAGIGASAGGLDAFKKFFAAMPADSGVAFVLIPHLDPKHESLMVELLARYTKMPVVEAEEGMAALANRVYVIPPNKYMTISGGVLRLTGPVERGGLQTSIDLFLRSLANEKQEKAICIILSGTGSHGSLGLKAVKASGGMAMVQDPNTAEYSRMPQSAVATGLADYVMPVEQMPEALIRYIQHYYVNGAKTGAQGTEAPDHLNQVLTLLCARTKFDFRCYRQGMLTRRIERRMSLSHFSQIADYLPFLHEHPAEVKQLFRDLLISVTNFFRDAEAFQALETEVIAPLVRAREPDAPVRVWSAGCATGEEPYSLGILLLEQLAAVRKSCQLQIFATDVDEDALEVARRGIYPESISADVSPERLRRFFLRGDDASYQVSKPLREIVIFARQNLITDAPFSKLDLVVCRNLLIYLEPELQQKVIALLHFSLTEGGFLFLGPSETIGPHIDLFEPVSKKRRIYRRIGPSRSERVEIPIAAAAGPLAVAQRLNPPSITRPVNFADLTHRLLSNEEIISMNEELQSANEELETSKEELQSLNEELITVNNQLHDKVAELESAVTQVRQADEQARRLATILLDSNDAVYVHDFEGKITAWNRGAEKMTGFTGAEALEMNVEQMIPEELRAQVRSSWEELRRGERVNSWEAQRRTKDGRFLDVWVTATALKDEMGRPVAIAKTERDITEQKRAHARLEYEIEQRTTALRKSQEQFAAVLHTAADAIVTINAQGIIQSVNRATERMFGYTAAEMIGRNVKILMSSPYREEHDRYLANYARTGVKTIIGIGRQVMARRKDGSTFPVDLAVSEVEHLKLFTGILRDITRRTELEREVVEIASLEQRRIGQDLHDSVSQELTALNILAGDLAASLPTNTSSGSKLVEQIVQGLQRSQRELRAVMRGLLPVAVDTEGLMAALSDLADRVQQEGKATCMFDCPEPVTVADNLNATHLYLIAQEAVRNAIKHARPRNIRISLKSNQRLVLRVLDDGIGMPARPTDKHGGLGLRIMRNRAAIIGATLTISPAEPTGTLITCALARKNHETEPNQEASQDLDRG